ncbi:hypothetical protein ZHAS_00015077 [Anopheles sinensis]|uniref:Uncharacterized protein n=1 Tax=Anopheles sinensis TaxID=74873 RepID=A0A084WAA3_ANOSI|nr:hypothetical protein ZHAS_00015077 [Anopheles sinensis]
MVSIAAKLHMGVIGLERPVSESIPVSRCGVCMAARYTHGTAASTTSDKGICELSDAIDRLEGGLVSTGAGEMQAVTIRRRAVICLPELNEQFLLLIAKWYQEKDKVSSANVLQMGRKFKNHG